MNFVSWSGKYRLFVLSDLIFQAILLLTTRQFYFSWRWLKTLIENRSLWIFLYFWNFSFILLLSIWRVLALIWIRFTTIRIIQVNNIFSLHLKEPFILGINFIFHKLIDIADVSNELDDVHFLIELVTAFVIELVKFVLVWGR